MIGNLMLAVSTALFSGLLAVGQVNAVQPYQANQYGGSNVYSNVELSYSESYSYTGTYYQTALEGTASDLDTLRLFECSNGSVNTSVDNTYGYHLWLYDEIYEAYSPSGTDPFSIIWQHSAISGTDFNNTIRFIVPSDFHEKFDGFEFNYTVWYDNVCYGEFGTNVHYVKSSFGYNADGVQYFNWFGFNDISQSPKTYVNGAITSQDFYLTFKYYNYFICFENTWNNGHMTFSFNVNLVKYENLTSSYATGFNDGYTLGYKDGYSIGLSTAQQGTFHGLFNSIADTPLRFLYGLFNFDLFGTSMLVIILSLLTGIVVFGLVKKFWK